MPTNPEMTPADVLRAGAWATNEQTNTLGRDDLRNIMIETLRHNSRETLATLQGWKDDVLVGKLANLTLLLQKRWATPAWCTAASTDDHRNAMITNLEPRLRRSVYDLQAQSDQELARLADGVGANLIPIAEKVDAVPPAIDGDYIYFAANGLYRCRLDGSDLGQLSTIKCAHRPFIDGEYVYFAGEGLNRCKKTDGSEARKLDVHCRAPPFVDNDHVYFAGGPPTNRGLFRRLKDGSGREHQVDSHCHHAPVVDGDFVYFSGGSGGLFRRRKDGSTPEEQLDDDCRQAPLIHGEHVYFVGGDGALYRRFKDGKGGKSAVERIANACGSQPVSSGDYLVFAGSSGDGPLYQTPKMGGIVPYELHAKCNSGVALKDGSVYFIVGTTLYRSPTHDQIESEWMTRMWDRIKDRPLWQIAIPASHDSLALYGKASLFGAAIGPVAAVVLVPFLGLVAAFAVGVAAGVGADRGAADLTSAAQGLTIGGQLQLGIRWFDLRLSWWPTKGKYLPFHGIVQFPDGQDLDAVLADFKTFLDAHPHEIVFLDLRLEGGDRKSAVDRLVQVLGGERIVGKHFVSTLKPQRSTPAGCTPAELRRAKKQVIVLWEGDELDHPLLWSEREVPIEVTRQPGGNVTDEADMLDRTSKDLAWWAKNYREIQTTATASPHWWRLGVHTTRTGNGGLRDGADRSLPLVLRALRSKWKDEPWNVVAADLFSPTQYYEFTNAVIELNGGFSYA